MPAARSVSAEPAVEISWASPQQREVALAEDREHRRGGGHGRLPSCDLQGARTAPVPLLDDPGIDPVTGGRWPESRPRAWAP